MAREKWAGIWWISWFGIIGGFLIVEVSESNWEIAKQAPSSHFSLILLIVIFLSWVAFYVAAFRFDREWQVVWRLLTLMGTILAAITLLGIYFFVAVAPRLR